MSKTVILTKITGKFVGFIERYGWKYSHDEDDRCIYNKEGTFSIELSDEEIVLVSDEGDFLHIPPNIFASMGALVYYRAIPANFSIQ